MPAASGSKNVEIEQWQRFGPSIAIEPRYVEQLAEAMIEDGLVIEPDDLSEEDWKEMGHQTTV